MSNEFYNQEQKERYFDERENEYKSIRKIGGVFFNITKDFEENLDKDCSNFTTKEILDMYSSCATRSWEQLLNFNSQLKIYTSWCLKESLVDDNQNHYEEIDKKEMYDCLNLGLKETMIISRAELLKEIVSFDNVSDQFLVLALFEGLGGSGYKDFYELMPEQFEGNVVHLDGRDLQVSSRLVELAKESSDEYDRYNNGAKVKVGYKQTSREVIKDAANAVLDGNIKKNTHRIQRRLNKLEGLYGKAFGYVGLRNSGRIHELQQYMIQDNSGDVRATYELHKTEMELRYGRLQRIYRWVDEYANFFESPR